MPSEIYVDKIMDQTGAKSLFEQSGSNWVSGSGFPAGMIVNATVFVNSDRNTLSTSSDLDRQVILLGNYNKLSSSTKLLISVFCPIFGPNHSGVRGIGIKYGSAGTEWCGAYYYTGTGNPYGGFLEAHCYFPSHSTTGSQTVSLREGCANGTDTGRAFSVINPNSTDEARYYTTRSTIKVYEIM